MAGQFANSTAAIDNILTQEANRIGDDIHKATMHTSPWMDLIKQSTFPEGMGYELNTLIYDRALPVKSGGSLASGSVGVDWNALQTGSASSAAGFTDGQTTATGATRRWRRTRRRGGRAACPHTSAFAPRSTS